MAATMEKENKEHYNATTSSGRIFSPSKYQNKLAQRSSTGGVFGRILAASNAAKTETDAKLAKVLAARERAEAEAAKKRAVEEEMASRKLAEKVDQEEKDGLVAQQLSVAELENFNRWKREVAVVEEADRKLVERMMEEERKFQEKLAEQARCDEEFAAKMQTMESKEVEKFIKDVAKKWKKPKIVCSDVEDGMLVTVQLPHVARMHVTIIEETNTILVTACPDFSHFVAFKGMIPSSMTPQAIDINLDLKIVGKDDVTLDDVKTRYDGTRETAYIFVHNACLRTSKNAFINRVKSGFKRMFSGRNLNASKK